jgi:hypothetical protein
VHKKKSDCLIEDNDMKRNEIITALRTYFKVSDLVCPHAYKAFGERAWQFLDTEYLHTLLVIRTQILKAGMTCNNYNDPNRSATVAPFTQRGLRCNICQLVIDKSKANTAYLSAHVTGAGGDFDTKGMTAESARLRIQTYSHLLPYPIRMEARVSWLHFDVYDSGTGEPVTMFSA